ncbi:MAG: hypothetical protein WCG10_06115 [Chlamydiota bacterium]
MQKPLDTAIKNKKIYSQLHSSPFGDHLKPSHDKAQDAPKKIIPSNAQCGLREEFKKLFLPLLIDIFELRQMIDTYKMQTQSPPLRHFGKISKTPQEILAQLKQMQHDIEESQRWCSGVILQISKGIEEAQEALDLIKQKDNAINPSLKKLSFIQLLLRKLQGLIWKQKSPQ